MSFWLSLHPHVVHARSPCASPIRMTASEYVTRRACDWVVAFNTAKLSTGQMNSYKSLHLRDRLISWSLTKKRLFIILAIFIVFSVALLAKAAPRRMRSAYIDDESYGRPGVAYAPEDEWKPPLEWDPVLPVYTNFTRYFYHPDITYGLLTYYSD